MHESSLQRIGQVASQSGVSIDTIRYYERLGLLPRAPRTRGGFRLYSGEQVTRLRAILEAKRLGLTLGQIRDLFAQDGRCPKSHCAEVRRLLDERLAEIDSRIEELVGLRAEITRARGSCDESLAADGPCCPVVEDLGQPAQPRPD